MEGILGIVMIIIISLGAFVMITYLRKFENIERMAMIEKGLSPDSFRKTRRNHSTFGTLRISLLLIGGGLGLLLGYFLDELFYTNTVGYFSMLFIWGGIGLGAAYMIEEKKLKEEDRNIRL